MKYHNENLPLSCDSKTSFPWLVFSILSVVRERKIDDKNVFFLCIGNLKERKEGRKLENGKDDFMIHIVFLVCEISENFCTHYIRTQVH